MTDIRLDTGDDGETIALDCNRLVSNSAVLELKSPANTSAGTGIRRTLVHTSRDGLSINGHEDYSDGLSIAGVKSIRAKGDDGLEITGVKSIGGKEDDGLRISEVASILGVEGARQLQVENLGFISGKDIADITPPDPALEGVAPGWTKRLQIAGEIQIQQHANMFLIPGMSNYSSLQDLLSGMRKEIAALKTRISELETKVGG